MKLHLARSDGRNRFTGYGPGYVTVNEVRHERSLVVLPDRVLEWVPASFDDLTQLVFARLAELPVEILILGTGTRLRFPHPSRTQALADARIGLEVMDTHAACRTYNILLAEDRRVGAALLLDTAG